MGLIPTATSSRFYLELDGQACGFLRSVDGGSIKGEVVTEPPDGEYYVRKQLGPATPEPIELVFDLSVGKPVFEWIAEAWSATQEPRSGRIAFADAMLQTTKELFFEQALITSVTFPKLDGASKDAAYFTVVIRAEAARFDKGSGKLNAAASKSKQWFSSNFRVEIDGLDSKRVSRVDAFTVATGDSGSPIDFPDLRITLAQSGAETWDMWHRHFVVEGKSDPQDEKTGRLVLLDPALQEIGSVALGGLGIYRLAPLKAEAGAETVARVVADLYCERMELAL
jgi:hypothetical protein